MSFNVKFYVKPFRDIFESISSLFPQVVLIFGEDGLDMQCMDVGKVALGELYIPPESFTNYDFDGDEADNNFRIKVGVDLSSFVKILKCVSGEAECELIYDEGDEDILTLAFKSQNELFEYELKLLSIPDTDLTIPERDEDACVILSAAVYQKFTKDLASLGEELTITVRNDAVEFFIKSDSGSGTWTLQYDDPSAGGVALQDFSKEVKQRFALRYLQHFTKAVSVSNKAEVALKHPEPIEICCALPKLSHCGIMPTSYSGSGGDDDYPWGQIKFFLAPKIMDED